MIAPDPGVIIIEVKGWHPDDIVQGNHSERTVNISDRERQEVHPPGQARNYMGRLAGACENSPGRSWMKTVLSYNICRDETLSIRAVEIRIETDKSQIEFFRNNVLVCIIKIKSER